MLERFGVTEETWREGVKKDRNFLESESPLFVVRTVVALAGDPAILERAGQLFSSWELGREYRFTHTDGRRPDWYDRRGHLLGAVGEPGVVYEPAISPDEKSIVIRRASVTGFDLWLDQRCTLLVAKWRPHRI